MSEYRLTRDADTDLLDVFLYGFDMFGLPQAEEYRDSLTRCFELLAANPKLGRKANEFAPGRADTSTRATSFSMTSSRTA